MTGKIKWFNETRGFGFILGENGKDYFAHYSDFPGGHTFPEDTQEGRAVTFDPVTDKDGRTKASKIQFT